MKDLDGYARSVGTGALKQATYHKARAKAVDEHLPNPVPAKAKASV